MTPSAATRPAIGVDIGGTKVAAGIVAPDGTVEHRTRRATPTLSPRDVEDAIVDAVVELRSGSDAVAIGIGAAGWVDRTQSIVQFSPHLAWRNEPLRERLAQRLDLPVVVDNDANAAAWAEFRFGAGRGARVMVCVTLGTGIGGALVVNGELFRGAYGMAGEWGHMTVVPQGHWCPCGNRGCWEQYASGNALVRDARALVAEHSPRVAELSQRCGGDPTRLTGPDVTAAALAGDRASIELLADLGHWLGLGMANLAAALDPDLFVVGGGVSEAGGLLLDSARHTFERSLTGRGFRTPARVELADHLNDAGLVGAADLARCSISSPPCTRSFWPSRDAALDAERS